MSTPQDFAARDAGKVSDGFDVMVPHDRNRYLADIAGTVRAYHARTAEQVTAIKRADAVAETMKFAQERGADFVGLDTLSRDAAAEGRLRRSELGRELA